MDVQKVFVLQFKSCTCNVEGKTADMFGSSEILYKTADVCLNYLVSPLNKAFKLSINMC